MNIRLLILFLVLASTAAYAVDDGAKEQKRSTKPGWLGVSVQDVTPRFVRDHELKIKEGAYVTEVVDDSPADSAGLTEGDVIVEFNGKKIEASDDLTNAVRASAPGTKVTVKVNRNGQSKSIALAVGKLKLRHPYVVGIPRSPRVMVNLFGGGFEGMDLMELNKQLAEYFEAPGGKGVLVQEVDKDENASKAGIKAGDIITKIGNETIGDIDDVREAMEDLEEGDTAKIELLRKGKKVTASLEISDQRDRLFWKNEAPEHFNFHIAPHIERMQKDLEIKLRELPRKQRDLERIEAKSERDGV